MESYEKTEARKLADVEKGRRKVQRVSQARQQANNWLSETRQRVENEKSRNLQELISEVTTEVTDQAIRNLEELSRIHLSAVAEIGTAHRAAAEYPDYQGVKERKSVEYEKKAQDRYSQAVRKSRLEETLRQEDAQRLSKIRHSVRAEEDLKAKSLVDRRPFRVRNVEVKPETLREKLKKQGYQQSLAKTLDVPGVSTDNRPLKHVVKKRTGKKSSSRQKKHKAPAVSKPKRVAPLEVAATARATGVKVQPMHRYHPKRSPGTSPVARMRRPQSKKKAHLSHSPHDVLFVDSNIPLPPQKYKAPDGLAVKIPYDPALPSAWEKAKKVNHEQDEADKKAAHSKVVIGKKTKQRGKKALKIARLEQRYNQLATELMTTIEEEDEESNVGMPSPQPPPTDDLATRLKAKYEEIMADADAQLKYLNSEDMETETLPKRNVSFSQPITAEPKRISMGPPPPPKAVDQGDQGPGVRPSALTAATDFATIAKARLDQLMSLGEELETVPFPQLVDWVHTPTRPLVDQGTTSQEEKRKSRDHVTSETPFPLTPSDFAERLKAKFDEIMTTGVDMSPIRLPSGGFVPGISSPQLPSPKLPAPPSVKLDEAPQTQPIGVQEEAESETSDVNAPKPPSLPKEKVLDNQVVTITVAQRNSRIGQEMEAGTISRRQSRPKPKKKVPSIAPVPIPPPGKENEQGKSVPSDVARKCLRHYISKLLEMNPGQLSKLSSSQASSVISDSSNVQINSSAVSTCASTSNGSVTPGHPPADLNQSRRASKNFQGRPQETSTPTAAWIDKSKEVGGLPSSPAAAANSASSSLSSKFPEVDVNVVYDSTTDGSLGSSPVGRGQNGAKSQDNLRQLLAGLCLRQAYCLSSPPPPSTQVPNLEVSPERTDGNRSVDIDQELERRLAALLARGKPGGSSGPGSTSDEGRLRGGTSTPTRQTSLLPVTTMGRMGTGTSTDDDEFQLLPNSPLNISIRREHIPTMIGQVADQWRRISIERPEWSDLESLPDIENSK